MKSYQIIDAQTGEIVAKAQSLKLAHRKADRLDLAYGAVRYYVRAA